MACYITNTAAASQYTGALAQNESETEAIPGFRADGSQRIRGLTIRSKENLAWRVELLDGDGNIIASHSFLTTDGSLKTIGTTPYYFYDVIFENDWCIAHAKDYKCNIAIRNLSADTKTAGDDGELVLYVQFCAK